MTKGTNGSVFAFILLMVKLKGKSWLNWVLFCIFLRQRTRDRKSLTGRSGVIQLPNIEPRLKPRCDSWSALIPLPPVDSVHEACCHCSITQLCPTLWTAACQVSLYFTISWRLLKLMPIGLVMPSNSLVLCCPLVLLSPVFPSIRIFPMSQFFASGGQSIGASASAISPSNEYSGLISFRMNWLDLLAVQGTLQSLLQHHSSKASIL